jgi:hypothetical protein
MNGKQITINDETKCLAVVKWNWIAENYDDKLSYILQILKLKLIHPVLFRFPSGCSYCSKFRLDSCFGCPLNEKDSDCCCHEYHRWDNDRTRENAVAMLNRILAIPDSGGRS